MAGMPTATAEPVTEARERINIVSFLEEVRGEVEPNKQKILDALSAVHVHERNGVQLYQQYSQQAQSENLKKTWHAFGEQTRVHEQVAERCISALGGDTGYMSPLAKEIDKVDKSMLNVQASGMEGDLARLGNITLAEKLCYHNWKTVGFLARHIKDPGMARILHDAARIVERDEEMHVDWNSTQLDREMQKATTGM